MPSISNIFINFAVGWAHPIPRHIELTRSVLLLLVEENVGNFLKDARRQAVLTHSVGCYSYIFIFMVSYDHLLKCGNSVHASLLINGQSGCKTNLIN